MKKVLLATMVLAGAALFTNKAEAQVSLSVNLNLGGRPSWGLPGNQVGNFYYLPEIDSYYDIQRAQFVYLDGGRWVYNRQLPAMYRNYNLAKGYKVVVNEARPFMHADVYRKKYSNHYNTFRPQGMYADRRDDRSDRGRSNQRFDNRNDNGRWKSERGRG